MFKKNRSRREANSINAGSMADIAFLLLIFFLVTTSILEDKGILVRLPEWADTPIIPPIATNNVFKVSVNAQNKLMVRDKYLDVSRLKEDAIEFILNPQQKPNLASAPNKALISLVHDRSTAYETYLAVYNELKAAYQDIWEDMAQQDYGLAYEDLPTAHKRAIQDTVPMVISEAEPVDLFGKSGE